jgi:hypothetical protein
MISNISRVHWLSNQAFTGACAGDYTRATGYVTVECHMASQAKLKTTSVRSPVVRAIDC